MGLVAFIAMVVPRARLRCVLWLIVYLTIISVPVWIIAFIYISLDMLRYALSDGQSNINFVVHLSGAAVGAVTALFVPLHLRQRLLLRIR